MKKFFFCSFLILCCMSLFPSGGESYSGLMDRAEKLTQQRYDRNSRAFKIKSQELDDILDSKADRNEKIKRLKEFIRELETDGKKSPAPAVPAEKPGAGAEDPFRALKEAAGRGEAEACHRLGVLYWEGKQVPRSLTRARSFFLRAAKKNYVPSLLMLAVADMNGKGVIPDEKKAFVRLAELYGQGYAAAGLPLGILYYEGRGTEKNYVKAAECLRRGLSMKSGIPVEFHPETALGRMFYFGGYGLNPEPSEAVKYLSAARPDPENRYLLGLLFLEGRGTVRNPAAAADCFRQAASFSHLPAGKALGRMYYQGTGVEKDDLEAVRYLVPAADRGDAEAAMLAGKICADPKSPAADEKEALRCYRMAARQGNPEAQYLCGRMIRAGIGTEKNENAALEYLRSAAAQGHAEAAFLCGEAELSAKHPDRSVAYFRRAAEKNHPEAIRMLAGMALGGSGMKADPEQGIRYLKQLAGQGDRSAQEQLGALYESGIGNVNADLRESIRYYTLAAEGGSTAAKARLGLIYYASGDHERARQYASEAAKEKHPDAILLLSKMQTPDKADPSGKADSYLRELADRGDRNAMRQLGEKLYERKEFAEAEKYLKKLELDRDPAVLFMLGMIACERSDGKNDYNRAFQLLEQAAAYGFVKARLRLGRMYHRGEGVRQDFHRALILYRQAAEKQDPEGMFLTGSMFYNGEGVSPDYAEAYRWFRQAAEHGNVLAMQYLSVMYKEGIGVPKNNREAAKWRKQAAGARR